MIGSSADKNFFYNQNAIEIKSNVWMEWNYNSIIQPFITATSFVKPIYIGPDSGWSSTNGSTITYTASSKISINQNRAIPENHYAWNMKSDGTNKVTNIQVVDKKSDTISYDYTFSSTRLGYYKIVFYAKAQLPLSSNQNLLDVKDPEISSYPSGGTSSFTYAVQSVGQYGQLSKILNAGQVTVTGVGNISSINPVNVTWSAFKEDGAIAYNIFRKATNTSKQYDTFAYLNTVQKINSTSDYTALYKDTAQTIDPFATTNVFEQNYIDLIPTISLYNSLNNFIPFEYRISSFDVNNGSPADSEKTIRLDGSDWQKIEIYFYSQKAIKKINFKFYINSFFIEPFVQISPIWLYEISESDYYNNKYFPLDSIFIGKRPGEALLNPFLDTFDNSASFNYYRDISAKETGTKRKSTYSYMNVSNIYEKTADTAGYFQTIPSRSSKYKYYISDVLSADKGISAYYDQYLSVNKIYIKMNDIFTSHDTSVNTSSFVIYFNKSDGSASSVLLQGPFNFDANGISVFYYKDNQWLNSSGSAFSASIRYSASSNSITTGGWLPPKIGNNGQVASAQIFTQMTGLAFKPAFKNSGMFTDVDDSRLHLIEISPRLEIDITDYVESYSISKELTNEASGNDFPLGFITSNSGEITINNFPVYYNNKPLSIFENKSNQTFLYDLLTQGVKFTGYFRSTVERANFTKTIPSFVLYSEDWNVDDINNISVTGFDAMKTFLMSNESTQYVAAGENLESVINHLLSLAGFSDYSKAELSRVCKNKTQFNYFWTEESKTIASCLQELFISNQIGCFLDESGFMRFIDIDSIISKKIDNNLTSDIDISDITHSKFNYLPNLENDSYKESLGTTIGKIIVNYNLPNAFTSPAMRYDDNNISEQKTNVSSVFSEESNTGLAHSYLSQSFLVNSSEFKITNDYFDKPKNNPGVQTGTFFIGCEAVKTDGHKYSFVVSGSPGYTFSKIIRYDSDINDAVQESISQFGILSSNIKYNPTGYFPGVVRGCYGTKIKDHPIVTNDNASTYFQQWKYGKNISLFSSQFSNEFTDNACTLNTAGGTRLVAVKNVENAEYNHFSLVFKADKGAVTGAKTQGSKKAGLGIFYNFNGSNFNDSVMIFIEKNPGIDNKGAPSQLCFRKMNGDLIPYITFVSDSNGNVKVSDQYKINLGKNLFDGAEHRFSIWINHDHLIVRIDDSNNYIRIKSTPATYGILSKRILSNLYMGFFVSGADAKDIEEKNPQSVIFKEFYAANFPRVKDTFSGEFDLTGNPKYHIQCSTYLTNMLNHGKEPSYYLWQDKPKLVGFKHYKNEKYQAAPALTDIVQPLFTGYDPAWRKASLQKSPALRVEDEDLAKSRIDAYPFMFDQIVINNTSPLSSKRTILFLKTNSDTLPAENGNTISISPYQILSQRLFFTTDRKFERIIDPNHINNSIQMNTRWIQSERDARQVIKKISGILPQFNSTLQLSVFGNPLLQVGDVAGIWYSLKNLGFDSSGNPTTSLKYFITQINQSWDGGLNTQLSLKPIR